MGSLGMCLRDVLLGFFQVGAPYLHPTIKRGFSHTWGHSELFHWFFTQQKRIRFLTFLHLLTNGKGFLFDCGFALREIYLIVLEYWFGDWACNWCSIWSHVFFFVPGSFFSTILLRKSIRQDSLSAWRSLKVWFSCCCFWGFVRFEHLSFLVARSKTTLLGCFLSVHHCLQNLVSFHWIAKTYPPLPADHTCQTRALFHRQWLHHLQSWAWVLWTHHHRQSPSLTWLL